MLKHHDADLDRYMDRLAVEGTVAIPYPQLYLIFNAERLNKNVYREILRRWEDLCKVTFEYSSVPKLTVIHTESTFTIFREVFKEHEKEEILPLESLT